MKEYKVVSLAPTLVLGKKDRIGATEYVEGQINQHASMGWTYHSMETFSEVEKKGCLGSVDPQSRVTYYVVIFEREVLE